MKVAVMGATGYVGEELVRLLLKHPEVESIAIHSSRNKGKYYYELYGQYFQITKLKLVDDPIDQLAKMVDLIFLALPNGLAMEMVSPSLLDQVKIIDLSGDYRLNQKEDYKHWYGIEHKNDNLLSRAVYGLSEWNRDDIKKSNLIANPGCYVTCSLLSLLPLVKEGIIAENIIVDGKSGISGAGKTLSLGTHFVECNQSVKAYKVGDHRHTPEIEQNLNIRASNAEYKVNFIPHLIPMSRGILVTCYCNLKEIDITEKEIREIYKHYYDKEAFVRVLPSNILPETKWVKGSNFCDINVKRLPSSNQLVVFGAIDNLIKGAAGQAIQNMNILFGYKETLGIDQLPLSI